MELGFLPNIGKLFKEGLDVAADTAFRSFNALQNYVQSVIAKEPEPEPFRIELDEEGSRILKERAKNIPDPRLDTAEGILQFAKDVARELPRSAVEVGLKISGKEEFQAKDPISRIVFGSEPIQKPEGALETTFAVIGSIPFGFGKKVVAKGISDQVIAKYGKTVGQKIIKEGGEELAQKSIIKGGEDAVNQFFALQRPRVVQKLAEAVKTAQPARSETERLFTAERAVRAVRGERVLEKQTGEQAFRAATGQLKGELPKAEFEGLRGVLKQVEVDELFDITKNFPGIDFYTKINASNALGKVLTGKIPGQAELELLERIYGTELIQAIRSKRPIWDKVGEVFNEIWNVPRAIISSIDFSGVLRQGLLVVVHKPKIAAQALPDMFRSFGSEKMFQAFADDITRRPTFDLMKRSGLFLADITHKAGGMTAREEVFISSWAEKIPILGRIVRASSRAYAGFLNKVRADVFDDLTKEFMRGGFTPNENPQTFISLARFINNATGRGELGFFTKGAPVLNGVFFSPRFMAARVNMLNPLWYAQLDPRVRVEAMKSFIKLIGAGFTVLTLANIGGAETESDPRSSDFGKIKMGNVRWDIWGGFQQFVRFGAQMITGQIKGTKSGELKKIDPTKFPFESRFDLGVRFLRGKFNPSLALITDLLAGRNIVGEKAEFDVKLLERIMPIYLQDMQEAVQEMGATGMISVGVPAIFGVGTQVFTPEEMASQRSSSGGFKLPALPKLPQIPSLSP